MALTPSKKDQLEAESLHSKLMSSLVQDLPSPARSVTTLLPPLPTPVEKKHYTPEVKKTQPGSAMAAMMEQFQQSHLRNASPMKTPVKNPPVKNMPAKNTPIEDMPVKDTPVKDMPAKGDLAPSKKVLTPDQSVEPPIKKQCTGSPSSEWESETDHRKGGKNKQKKKKKKKVKSDPIMVSDSEMEETEEQQEKCQQAKKWARELLELRVYRESRNIFLHDLQERNGSSHMGYLEGRIHDAEEGYFFIWLISNWRNELQKQSQGVSLSASTACRKLQTLECMDKVKLSNIYGIRTEYLVEVFKYPSTGNRIPSDFDDMYGMTQMIGLYGLVNPYSSSQG